MLARLRDTISPEKSGLHGAAFLLALSSLASGLLALLRDRIFAAELGAGTELDIYYAAFRVPDFLFATIASFVSVSVLIPLLVKSRTQGEETSAQRFWSELLTVFSGVMLLVSVVVFFAMPMLADLTAPGFSGDSRSVYISLARLLLLSPLLLGISNLLGSVTQSLSRFFATALSPIVYNLGIIFGALFLYPRFGIMGLGYGVVVGALLHGAIQLPVVLRAGYVPRLSTTVDWDSVRDVVRLSIPRTLGLGMSQFVIMAITAFASSLAVGSISILTFAYNLQSFVLSIIGVSYSVAVFPKLSEQIGKGELSLFRASVVRAGRQIVLLSLPVALVGIFFRDEIVTLLLGAGRFTELERILLADLFGVLLASVWAQGLLLLFTRAYYAAGETKKPLFANSLSAVLTVLGAYLSQAAGYGLFGLGLAFSLGMFLNVILQAFFFRRDFPAITHRS